METRRWVGRAASSKWVVCAVMTIGCGEEPRRFVGDASAPITDLGSPRDVGVDAGFDASDAPRLDVARDVSVETAVDAGYDAADSPRDVVAESTVLGCRTNADCPSPDLYCNGPGCDAPGFCVPRRVAMSCPAVDAAVADLVCGCDGMTYGSLCQLQSEGVRLVRFGLCPRD